MIKMLTAYTLELDDPEAAVNEIAEQLDIKNALLKNSVGLLFCYADFVSAGIAEAVCKALPFDVVGCTTQGIVVRGVAEMNMLALAVLTSDETEFSAGLSDPLGQDLEGRVEEAYRKTSDQLKTPPSLIFTFFPQRHNISGDILVAVLNGVSGGKPVFGSVALDVTTKSRDPLTIHNGTAYGDRMVLVLFSSPDAALEPRFAIDSISDRKFHSQSALVTASDNNRIISINNMPATAYLEQVGLMQNGAHELLFAFPLAVDEHKGGKPKLCTAYAVDSGGSLICGSTIAEGSTLNIGTSTAENVLITASSMAGKVRAERNWNGLFIIACFSRNIVLLDPGDEIELIRKQMEDSPFPYIFLYAAGEICPEYDDKAGEPRNQYHQYSIISCMI
jgi:hypothetical protein